MADERDEINRLINELHDNPENRPRLLGLLYERATMRNIWWGK